jgi:hypothetical protein
MRGRQTGSIRRATSRLSWWLVLIDDDDLRTLASHVFRFVLVDLTLDRRSDRAAYRSASSGSLSPGPMAKPVRCHSA